MAEKPQLRSGDQDHFSDDDPFAELTRIMGFDPREPVRQEPDVALGAAESSDGQLDSVDFGIDLEKELMGEFAGEEPSEPHHQLFEPAGEVLAALEEPAYEPETTYEAAEPVVADDSQAAFADFEPAEATTEAFADEAHAFDSAVAASIEHELSLDGDWIAAEEEAVHFDAASYEQSDDLGHAADISADQAPQMFEAPPQEDDAAPQEDLVADDGWELVDEAHAGAPDEEPQLHLPQDTLEVASPEPQAAADAGQSLEDELNALLGNMSGHAAPAEETIEDQSPVVEQDVEAVDPQDEPEMALSDDDLAADASAPAEEAPVDYSYARSNYRAEDVAYAAPVVEDANVEAVGFDEEADLDVDLSFDEEAFDAAFADSIESAHPVTFDSEPMPADEAQGAGDAEADPYADLASLTARFMPSGPVHSWQQQSSQPEQTPVQYDEAAYDEAAYDASDDGREAAAGYDDLPDIETVEVPEPAVALSDDLDIPEIDYQDEPAPAYDDIDAEFASLLNDMNSPEPSPVAPPREAAYGDDLAGAESQAETPHYAAESAYPAAAVVAGAAAAYGQAQPAAARLDDFDDQDFAAETKHAGYRQQIADDLDYDPDLDEDMEMPAYQADQARQQPQRRGMLIAAIVGGVAIIGGIGAFALAGGGGGSQAPAIVKADDSPIKVRPENPGGTKVPNQDNQVYDAVSRTAGATAPQPQQEKLVTTAEEPVDMAAQEPEPSEPELAQDTEADAPAPTAKSEDRIEQLLDENGVGAAAEVPVVAPRKVRTMIVKADGTLVAREDPAPEVAAAAPDANPTAAETMIDPDVATTLSTESTAAVPSTAAAEPVPAEAGAAPAVAQTPQASTTPNSVSVAPTRPSDQPVDVVGEVKADKVAALAPAAASGAWSMQIASQPSEAAAQSSYQDLMRRYGSVLNGHQANIVKAEIAGKGTFWRVRVPAETRNDAIKLCESYKAAGGNCFVSK